MTPRSRNWSRTSGRRVAAGLLIGLGLLPGLTVVTLGTACLFVVGLFGDVSLSLWLEKMQVFRI